MRQAEDQPDRPPQIGRRGDISVADAITAAARLGATDPADLDAIIDVLDLRLQVVPTPPGWLAPSPFTRSGTSSPTPSAQLTTPKRGRITGTPIAARLRQDDRDEAKSAPAWLDVVRPLAPPDSGSFDVPSEPPLPAVQARSAMAALAATWRPGRRLDMIELIEQCARLQPLTASFLAELRTASYMQLLVDRGEGMEPYADDLDYLTTQFIDVAGRDQVEQRTFVGTPLRGLDPDVFTGKVKEWKRPPPNSLVLVLTDLGVGGPTGSRDRASASEWRAAAAAVAAIPAEFRVVTPFRPTRWPRGITHIGQIVSWDALVDLERLRG